MSIFTPMYLIHTREPGLTQARFLVGTSCGRMGRRSVCFDWVSGNHVSGMLRARLEV